MCFDVLTEDDVTERPVGDLFRAELPDALGNGAMAAVIVASVLFSQGVGGATIAVVAVAALVLGTVTHQAVLLVGVGVLRARDDGKTGTSARAV